MIAGLDSAYPPSAESARRARAAGVKLWWGYIATRPNVGLLNTWSKDDFDTVRAAGIEVGAMASGWDDPAAVAALAKSWGIDLLCLDDEVGIRGDGPWVQGWLDAAGAGLYGNFPVFFNRRGRFYVLASYPGYDPQATWPGATPGSPHGWQWQGTHDEFGASVDRGWYDDRFVSGGLDVAQLDEIQASLGQIWNTLNWGTPVGGAVPQGWMPIQLKAIADAVSADTTAIEKAIGDAQAQTSALLATLQEAINGLAAEGIPPANLQPLQDRLDKLSAHLGVGVP